jgi:hypothetical protein
MVGPTLAAAASPRRARQPAPEAGEEFDLIQPVGVHGMGELLLGGAPVTEHQRRLRQVPDGNRQVSSVADPPQVLDGGARCLGASAGIGGGHRAGESRDAEAVRELLSEYFVITLTVIGRYRGWCSGVNPTRSQNSTEQGTTSAASARRPARPPLAAAGQQREESRHPALPPSNQAAD